DLLLGLCRLDQCCGQRRIVLAQIGDLGLQRAAPLGADGNLPLEPLELFPALGAAKLDLLHRLGEDRPARKRWQEGQAELQQQRLETGLQLNSAPLADGWTPITAIQ